MKTRAFLPLLVLGGLALVNTACEHSQASKIDKKVIVLGFDGMDYQMVKRMMTEGKLPNLRALSEGGSFKPLGTSVPPQSPVAWSNFITGMNPGGHGIYDFIHRDAATLFPVSSTARTEEPSNTIKFGKWVIPLSAGKVENLRKGKAFWEVLDEHDIPATVFRVPANFPPIETEEGKSLSGMGTPDVLGSYGTFSYYTDDPPPNRDEISGGVVYPVQPINNQVEAELVGPKNTFLAEQPDATVPFKVWRDPEHATAKIQVGGHEFLLQEGEWSPWLQVEFTMIPGLQSVTGICRFYLKEVWPKFKLYVTPINIDPSNPALPISAPGDYAKELHHDCGHFYTQGMPEDTKALSWGVFDYEDFRVQSDFVLQERLRLYHRVLDNFHEGLLFFYFSSSDQQLHMFWKMIDPEHPAYDPQEAERFAPVIESIYRELDAVVGKAMERADANTTLMVMSDHGFAPFRRAVHLNTWLKEQGYITLLDESKQAESEFFQNVDWSKTRAYGVGFNGLYVNLRGREAYGTVSRRDKEALMRELTERLLAMRDPRDGAPVVLEVYRGREIYSGAYVHDAPDLVVGYNRGYRASWETTIGNFQEAWIEDNMDPWSGDHCMAAHLVPGVILTNKPVQAAAPRLYDLAPTILAEFGIEKLPEMVGHPIFGRGTN